LQVLLSPQLHGRQPEERAPHRLSQASSRRELLFLESAPRRATSEPIRLEGNPLTGE
jgi:hypothetical protein